MAGWYINICPSNKDEDVKEGRILQIDRAACKLFRSECALMYLGKNIS